MISFSLLDLKKKLHYKNTHPASESVATDFSFFFFFFPMLLFRLTFFQTTLLSSSLILVFFVVLSSSCAICSWYSCSSSSSGSSTWLSVVTFAPSLLFPFLLLRFGPFPPPVSSWSTASSESVFLWLSLVLSLSAGRRGRPLLLFFFALDVLLLL